MILNFRSDNCSPVISEIIAALSEDALTALPANRGKAYSETLDQEVTRRFGETFGSDVGIFSTFSGTGTNALAIAALLDRPEAPIICHEDAHINVFEEQAALYLSRAPGFTLLEGPHGRIAPARLEKFLKSSDRPMQGGVLALTQPTEAGTCYSLSELRALRDLCRAAGLSVYIDGARLGSALAALEASAAEFVGATGVDALSFGGTKVGGLAAEAVVFISPSEALMARATRLYRSGGQRVARRRFINVQLLRLLKDDLWIAIARRQNERCRAFADLVGAAGNSMFVHPVETNQVFIRYSDELASALDAGNIRFTRWTDGSIRLVFCHNHTLDHIRALARAVRSVSNRPGLRVGSVE